MHLLDSQEIGSSARRAVSKKLVQGAVLIAVLCFPLSLSLLLCTLFPLGAIQEVIFILLSGVLPFSFQVKHEQSRVV